MKRGRFKKRGRTYLRIHSAGVIITLVAIIFLMPVYMAIIRGGFSISSDLYHMFVYTTCTAFWCKWIA